VKITQVKTLHDLGFKKERQFPKEEKDKIVKAVENIQFKDFNSYSKNFEKELAKELGSNFCINSPIFEGNKHSLDFYNPELKIGIEIEKTKTTTLLLNVIKLIVGYKNEKIDFGVLMFPDKYRNKTTPEGHQDKFLNRLENELNLIKSILEIKDILIIEYDTSCFF